MNDRLDRKPVDLQGKEVTALLKSYSPVGMKIFDYKENFDICVNLRERYIDFLLKSKYKIYKSSNGSDQILHGLFMQWLGNKKVFQLFDSYCQNNNIKYDCVMKCRYDIFWKNAVDFTHWVEKPHFNSAIYFPFDKNLGIKDHVFLVNHDNAGAGSTFSADIMQKTEFNVGLATISGQSTGVCTITAANPDFVGLVRGQLDQAKCIDNHLFGLQQFIIGQSVWETYLKGEEKNPRVAMQNVVDAVHAEMKRG